MALTRTSSPALQARRRRPAPSFAGPPSSPAASRREPLPQGCQAWRCLPRAGATADAFTLFERLESKLEEHSVRAARRTPQPRGLAPEASPPCSRIAGAAAARMRRAGQELAHGQIPAPSGCALVPQSRQRLHPSSRCARHCSERGRRCLAVALAAGGRPSWWLRMAATRCKSPATAMCWSRLTASLVRPSPLHPLPPPLALRAHRIHRVQPSARVARTRALRLAL